MGNMGAENANGESRHAAIVYHPVKVSPRELSDTFAAAEREHGWGVTRWYPTSADDAGRGAAETALADGAAVVIIAGGDGTVRVVADTVAQSNTGVPIALLPTGTGNLLARNLGLPLNQIEASLATAFSGEVREIDVGVADLEDAEGERSTHTFLVMAGIGLDAEMAEHTSASAKKRLGWLAYVTPIARSIVRNQLFHLKYRIDRGRVKSTRAHTVIVGNCGTLTGNLLLIPSAVIDDGQLDVVIMRPKGRFGWARIGTRLTMQGIARTSRLSRKMLQSVPELEALAYAQGAQFEARFETPHLIELDGDSFGHVVRVRMRVRPLVLRVLT